MGALQLRTQSSLNSGKGLTKPRGKGWFFTDQGDQKRRTLTWLEGDSRIELEKKQ